MAVKLVPVGPGGYHGVLFEQTTKGADIFIPDGPGDLIDAVPGGFKFFR